MSLVTRNPVFGVCDQGRLKPACAATEARQRFEISDIETRGIILSRQWTTKALIRLRGCAGWSAPLLFAYGITGFSWSSSYVFVVFTTGRFMLSLALLCVIVLFQSCLALWSPRLGERELAYVLLVYLFAYFARVHFVLFLFLLVSGVGWGVWLCHSLDLFIYLFIFVS